MAWRRGVLLRQELDHLRQTLNSWSGESERAVRAAREEVQQLRTALLHLITDLNLEPEDETPEACFNSIRKSHRLSALSARALKKANTQLKSLQMQLETTRESLQQTKQSGGMISGQLEEVQQLLTMTIAERDQLKYRLQEKNRRSPGS